MGSLLSEVRGALVEAPSRSTSDSVNIDTQQANGSGRAFSLSQLPSPSSPGSSNCVEEVVSIASETVSISSGEDVASVQDRLAIPHGGHRKHGLFLPGLRRCDPK